MNRRYRLFGGFALCEGRSPPRCASKSKASRWTVRPLSTPLLKTLGLCAWSLVPGGGDDGRRGVRGDIETVRVEARQGRSIKGCAPRAGPPRCPPWQRPGQPNRRHRLRIPINPTSCSSSNPPAIAIRFRHPGCSGWLSRASAELSTVAGGGASDESTDRRRGQLVLAHRAFAAATRGIRARSRFVRSCRPVLRPWGVSIRPSSRSCARRSPVDP